MDKNNFIGRIKDAAVKQQQKYGILASLTIAQAILESGWGSSQLSVKANNLFGIKAFSGWTGKRIIMKTSEWKNGRYIQIDADFRAYNSFEESIEDHSRLLMSGRYTAVRQSSNYREACEAIYKCGYATDPKYSSSLISIIKDNNLDNYDRAISHAEAAVTGEKMPLLKEGSTGAAVRLVQKVVGTVPVDGDFGPVTKKKVMEYQRAKGLKADGIVGRNTWNAILKRG